MKGKSARPVEKERIKAQDLQKEKDEEKEKGGVVTPKRDRLLPRTVWLEDGSRTSSPTFRTLQKEKDFPQSR